MKTNFNFDVIIIGSNHINTLGAIRSFGENGIRCNVILIGKKKCYTLKSKYIKNKWVVSEKEEELISLLSSIKLDNNKIYLIPTSDFAAYALDKNFDSLSQKYILPNIEKKQGKIIQYMDKNIQYRIAHTKVKMATTKELDLLNIIEEKDLSKFIPCILKPIISAGAKKSDIVICNNFTEAKNSIEELKNKGYKRVLIQNYIDYDYECDISGISDGKNTFLSNIIKKINIYPSKRGSTSCGRVIANDNLELSSIIYIINELKYNGIFDVEVFVKNGEFYLNEINFRNSAVSYGLTKEKNYIPYSWVMLNEGNEINIANHIKDYTFVVEDFELKSLLKREIRIREYLSHKFFAKKKIYFSLKDTKPYFYKLLYMIRKEK